MTRGGWIVTALFCLTACGNAPSADTPETAEVIDPPSIDQDVSFKDILSQYQALNTRLETTASRIQVANAVLCPVQSRDPGFTVHTVYDYPEHLREAAQTYLNVSENLSIRTVRSGSPADRAGLKAGDDLIAFGERYFPSGPTARLFYDDVSRRAFQTDGLEITVGRDGSRTQTQLSPQTICGYPVTLFFSERINGHTDGKEVWITSELLRSVQEDESLALVIAHEMAHAIAGHLEKPASKKLELAADRMALVMLARAGFDIEKAVADWQSAPHPHVAEGENWVPKTHPTRADRLANFNRAVTRIMQLERASQEIGFEPQKAR